MRVYTRHNPIIKHNKIMAATTTEENPMIRLRPSDDDGVVDGGLLISKKAALGSSFFKTIIDSGCGT